MDFSSSYQFTPSHTHRGCSTIHPADVQRDLNQRFIDSSSSGSTHWAHNHTKTLFKGAGFQIMSSPFNLQFNFKVSVSSIKHALKKKTKKRSTVTSLWFKSDLWQTVAGRVPPQKRWRGILANFCGRRLPGYPGLTVTHCDWAVNRWSSLSRKKRASR